MSEKSKLIALFDELGVPYVVDDEPSMFKGAASKIRLDTYPSPGVFLFDANDTFVGVVDGETLEIFPREI